MKQKTSVEKKLLEEFRDYEKHPHIWRLDNSDRSIEICAICDLRKKKIKLTNELWIYRHEKK